MPEQPVSSARLRRIGRTLQEIREEKGWSQQRSGLRLERSGSSLSLIENGLQPLRVRDLKHILNVYGVRDRALRAALFTLAEQDRQSGWWADFRDIASPSDRDYTSLEHDATNLDAIETRFIPGLFQSEDYARSIIRSDVSALLPERIDRLVAFRMARQQILHRESVPRLRVVLDEAALRRAWGGRAVMKAQLERLVVESERDHISLQVLPFSCAADARVSGTFWILDIGSPTILSAVLITHLTGRWILDDDTEISRYRQAFERVRLAALCETDSRALICRIASEP